MPHIDLLELPYFQGISLDSLVSLVDRMAPCQFKPSETIFEESVAPIPSLYIITHGNVALSKKNALHVPRPLAEVTAPTLIGEIELFCQIPAVMSATAVTRVSAFKLSRPTLDILFREKHPAALMFTFNVARVACHRLAIADEMLASVLEGEDLVKMRRTVFSRMNTENQWSTTTGVFKR
jgi:CRP-like cAMP-binding protein